MTWFWRIVPHPHRYIDPVVVREDLGLTVQPLCTLCSNPPKEVK
jgi:hypothetical protein